MPILDKVIFDFDGTLIDSQPGIAASAEKAFKNVLPGFPIPNFTALIGPPLRQMFLEVIPKDSDPIILNRLIDEFRISYDFDGWQNSILYSGVLETLNLLKKYKIDLWVLTNKRRVPVELMMTYHGLSHFDRVITSDSSLKNNKQSAFEEQWLKSKFQSQNSVLIGDSIDDLIIAKKFNLQFIAISYGYGSKLLTSNRDVKYYVEKFSEIIPKLKYMKLWL